MGQISTINWNLDSDQIKQLTSLPMNNANAIMQSPIVDNLWCLQMNREDPHSFGLFLKLVAIPPNVSQLTVSFTLKSDCLWQKDKQLVQTFAESKTWGFPDFFGVDLRHLSSLDIVLFVCVIEILNEIGIDGD